MKLLSLIPVFCLLFLSCETEESGVKSAPENNLVANTSLRGKLMRVVQSPTSADNLIDGSSCFAIQFPFSVIANGQQVDLTSEDDYQQVRDIWNESYSDEDTVTIVFPVDVTYSDYSEATITSQPEFDAIVSNCTGQTELSCMQLQFPLNVKTYDSENLLAESFDLETKKAMYMFLRDINAYSAATLDYPLPFTIPDGSVVTPSGNAELEGLIDSHAAECHVEIPAVNFEDVIIQGTWSIDYFFSGADQTVDYEQYAFDFNADGSIAISGGDMPIMGLWGTTNNGTNELAGLIFSSPELMALEGEWIIDSVTSTYIKLKRNSTGIEGEKFLYLIKN